VNDLIKLPLHLYRRAEWNALHNLHNNGTGRKGSPRKNGRGKQQQQQNLQRMPPVNLMNYQSSEMGELTTHFVSFLKSLAMRVNAETLQFFLSFPLNECGNNGGVVDREDAKALIGDSSSNMEAAATIELEMSAKLEALTETNNAVDIKEEPLFKTMETPPSSSPPNTTQSSNNNQAHQSSNNSYLERRKLVEFPLYSRALEFCAPEQEDSFVRVTAMNVCMNIIRLATVQNDEEDDDASEDGSVDDSVDSVDGAVESGDGEGNDNVDEKDCKENGTVKQKQPSPLPTATPTGMLDDAPTLPLQDRIAIAQYACHPKRVSDLVSPLCARLTSQFGLVEGVVRALEELNDDVASSSAAVPGKSSSKSASQKKKKQQPQDTNEAKRNRLRNTLQNRIANVQDELLLLDDLLKVGLISLNEQAIEMMLATFVYPMLLQPLLLPLHRFSSSKRVEKKKKDVDLAVEKMLMQDGIVLEKKGRKPVICLQSPVPFAKSTSDGGDESSSSEKNDKEESTTSNDTSNRSNNTPQQLYSSSDMDLAPSKTALLSISVIFQTVSNPTLRHLLLVALLHPFAPMACGGEVICVLPQIVLPKSLPKSSSSTKNGKNGRGVYSSDDFQLEIRMEKNQSRQSRQFEEFQRNVNVYTFGTEANNGGGVNIQEEKNNDFESACVFILAPALVDMLRNHTCCVDQGANLTTTSPATATTTTSTRLNPYRNILLQSISGSNEMVALQPLATAALHSAVSSVDSLIVQKIMLSFPPKIGQHAPTVVNDAGGSSSMPNNNQDENYDDDDDVKETLKHLCQGIVNTSITYDGWWKIKFNTVAARTLMNVIFDNQTYVSFVSTMMGNIRLEAAEILMTLPFYLDSKSRGGDDSSNISNSNSGTSSSKSSRKPNNNSNHINSTTTDSQYLDHWLLDRFFFDQADKFTNSIVENVCYLKEISGSTDDNGNDNDNNGNDEIDNGNDAAGSKKEQYRYGLEVLTTISINGTSALLCDDCTRIVDNMMVIADESSAKKGNTPFHCAASWALACLYLDAFCVKLSKMSSGASILDDTAASQQKRLSFISAPTGREGDENDSNAGFSLAHISSKFAIAMLDEGEKATTTADTATPVHGSAVGLVGKAAFPCVCEVSNSFSSLFSGRTCISNEGIQWQSLYLIVVGKWAVLAEPGHGGTGGEGRVITACRLACLAVKKDSSSLANNKTPARRLLLAHASLDPRPPSLFLVDSASSRRGGPNLGPNGLRLTRSRMDLWFEDANASGHACRVLSAKIAKARARRGGRIRAALLAK